MNLECSKVPFRFVCDLLEELDKRIGPRAASKTFPTREKRYQLKDKIIKQWFSKITGIDSLFSVTRLLLPHLDPDGAYYIKENRLVEILCSQNNFQLIPNSYKDILKRWRLKDDSDLGELRDCKGDLSLVLMYIFNCLAIGPDPSMSPVTITNVSETLSSLIPSIGSNLRKYGYRTSLDIDRSVLIQQLYRRLSPVESKWLTRIILKKLDLDINPIMEDYGISIMNSYHCLFSKVYNRQNNLRKTCSVIENAILAGHDSFWCQNNYVFACNLYCQVEIGTNIAIMQCVRCDGTTQLYEKMGNRTAFVETKYDGERVQFHYRKDDPQVLEIFSKSQRKSTRDRAACIPTILACIGRNEGYLDLYKGNEFVNSIILEAELLVYNQTIGIVEPFGSVKELHTDPNGSQVRLSGDKHFMLVFFDILFLNGRSLLQEPLYERRRLLESIIQVVPNHSVVSNSISIDFSLGLESKKRLEKVFQEHVERKEEGLIIKYGDSNYLPGSRSQWFKLKKDYIKGYGDTMSVCLLGGRYGTGRRAGLVSQFYVGFLVNLNLDEAPHFLILFTVELGLNAKQLEAISSVPSESNPFYTYSMVLEDGSESRMEVQFPTPLVCEILCSGFVIHKRINPFYSGGQFSDSSGDEERLLYSMRFPRIQCICENDTFHDATTFWQLQQVAKSQIKIDGDIETPKPINLLEEEQTANVIFQVSDSDLLNRYTTFAKKRKLPDSRVTYVFVDFDDPEMARKSIRRIRQTPPSKTPVEIYPLDAIRNFQINSSNAENDDNVIDIDFKDLFWSSSSS